MNETEPNKLISPTNWSGVFHRPVFLKCLWSIAILRASLLDILTVEAKFPRCYWPVETFLAVETLAHISFIHNYGPQHLCSFIKVL